MINLPEESIVPRNFSKCSQKVSLLNLISPYNGIVITVWKNLCTALDDTTFIFNLILSSLETQILNLIKTQEFFHFY